ncbi:MAG: hypothetical protein A3G35_02950 [candidate division NC10 bacterium RIFCSPLOWO2_12_FULL_66_18]|nr:MAG: hypothetical protein A3H39_09005 [candidate division NC10 bacterium RIFCSPLOWO2_02_FULL_66_22]OGB96809.1 MAG: hypothetical protein A3G35_02950 [candidate division NC10 bacterium RIFCSPLOWO2_12_FULL_66_18]
MKINGHIILFMTDLLSASFVHSLLIGVSPEGGAMQGPAPGHGCCPLRFRKRGGDDAGERLHPGPGGDEFRAMPARVTEEPVSKPSSRSVTSMAKLVARARRASPLRRTCHALVGFQAAQGTGG